MPGLAAPRLPDVLGAWHFEAPVVAVLVVAALAYRQGSRTVTVEPGCRAAFFAGLAAVGVALLSPLATYAEALLSVHMVQHLVLTLVAAPLLALGRPLTVLSGGRTLRWGTAARVAGHPLVAWVVFAAAGWAIHFSGLFDVALRHPAAHAAEHALFLGTALLFWAPVVGTGLAGRRPMSHPLRLLYLAVAMPQNTFLALAIFSTGDVLYRSYAEVARAWGPTPLADQRTAGGIMWMAGDLLLLVSVLFVANAWAHHEERHNAVAEA
ncbi:MAG: cytochrome c oxidase assembly protein [Actinomycetota bacterium]|nr:cytochrome c oxidase assembly protein [Actinomycetota bacterium]